MDQELAVPRIWDRQPNETEKAWQAFQIYREMPLLGPLELRRSFKNLAPKIGHDHSGTVQMWSSKYNWQERVKAYDANMALTVEDYKLASRSEAMRAYYAQMSTRMQAVGEIFDAKLETVLNRMKVPDEKGHTFIPDGKDLRQLVEGMRTLDNLYRRMLKLPTTFERGTAEEEPDEEVQLLVIGDKE